ncbi:MAG: hypothetical protein M1120_00695 [Patescibacteria group bacterium]|nr:hypothetical protein [Patescibacteria group bacterium]
MKSKELLIISILTFLTVVFWMVSQFVNTSKTSTITPVLQEQIKPIVPNFDTAVLNQLKNR